jgi:hypothetical protein
MIGVESGLTPFAVAMTDAATELVTTVAAADVAVSELVGRASLSTVPVATGELMRSGVFGAGQIVFTADHAPAVFGGTDVMPARPWILDAWDQSEPMVLVAYGDAVDEALERV